MNCRFWHIDEAVDAVDVAELTGVYAPCRRFPPQQPPEGYVGRMHTLESQWCGEWKPNRES